MRRRHVWACIILLLPFIVKVLPRTTEADFESAEAVRKTAEGQRLQRKYEEALASYQEAVRLDNENSKAHWGIGRILLEHSAADQALPFFKKAVELAQSQLSATPTSGASGRYVGNFSLSVMYLDLGVCFGEVGQISKQISAFTKSINLHYSDRTMTNLQRVRQYMCDWTDWDANLAHVLRLARNITTALASVVPDENTGLISSNVDSNAMHVPPQHALYYPFPPAETLSSAEYCAVLTLSSVQREGLLPFAHASSKGSDKKKKRKAPKHPWTSAMKPLPPPPSGAVPSLHVAYVSAQYGDNSLGWTLEHSLRLHARSRFRVSAIAMTGPPPTHSIVRANIASAVDEFLDVSADSVQQAALRINELGVHVLVDVDAYRDIDVVSGVSDLTKILALRPAPLAVNWLGACGSMGASFVHFLLSDRISSPPELASSFREALALVPASFSVSSLPLSYPNMTKVVESELGAGGGGGEREGASGRAARRNGVELGASEGVVFGDFNKAFKIDPQVFAAWMDILSEIPGSTLALGEAAPFARKNLRKSAKQRGVTSSRLLFPPSNISHGHHLTRRLPLVDIVLDTLHVSGHTTSKDALFAALPVVTAPTDRMVGRVAAGVVLAAGSGATVARSLEDYREVALQLARKPAALARLRQRIFRATHAQGGGEEGAGDASASGDDAAMAGLFETQRVVLQLEGVLRLMWERVTAGKRYAHLVLR